MPDNASAHNRQESDSVFVQADDQLIDLSGFAEYVRRIRDLAPIGDSISLTAHIDEEVPKEFLTKIIGAIPSDFHGYKVVRKADNRLGFVDIQ